MPDDVDTIDGDQRERLRRDVNAAINEIEAIRCPDPAAINAFLTARLTMHTLRDMWLPNI